MRSQEDIKPILRVARLIMKHLDNDLSEDERVELEAWIAMDDDHKRVFESVQDENTQIKILQQFAAVDTESALKKTLQQIAAKNTQKRYVHLVRYAAAASVIVFLCVYFVFKKSKLATNGPIASISSAVLPGGKKATLMLSNGKSVKLDDSVLIYKQDKTTDSQVINTLITPRGGDYELRFGDGTKIWLNAGSSVRYPAAFSATERRIEVSGEVYMDVAKDARRPFFIATEKTEVQVLGTTLNIRAYNDEAQEQATLITGSVRLNSKNSTNSVLLHPGTTAVSNSGNTVIVDADVKEVTAWMNGEFYFNDADLREVLQQLARWYDVNISYQGDQLQHTHFNGRISKHIPLQELLDQIESTGIASFTLENRTITASAYKPKI